MDEIGLKRSLQSRAATLGFDLFGVTRAVPSAYGAEYSSWLSAGYHGSMAYLARNTEQRLDPRRLFEGCTTLVVVGMNYYRALTPRRLAAGKAVFARYAVGDDYHDTMTARLEQLTEVLPDGVRARVFVDAGPVLEREVAARAGLGWIGKNTLLIAPRRGSYYLLGVLALDRDLPQDNPLRGHCGSCRRCLDACPTQAFEAPFVLDARKCISYATIESREPIPDWIGERMGDRVFGCDICQEVCPHNGRWACDSSDPSLRPRRWTAGAGLDDLASMTESQFREAFRGSAVRRAKWTGLMRNVRAAQANQQRGSADKEGGGLVTEAVP